jgi:hypothetical protein
MILFNFLMVGVGLVLAFMSMFPITDYPKAACSSRYVGLFALTGISFVFVRGAILLFDYKFAMADKLSKQGIVFAVGLVHIVLQIILMVYFSQMVDRCYLD